MHTTIPFLDGMDLETVNHNSQYLPNLQNRSLIVDVHAFGSFRKDLIKSIGLERTKGFMFHYGWDMEMQDAKK
jgi:PucR family transcriptional regulator, purine catabolism regulatory protein